MSLKTVNNLKKEYSRMRYFERLSENEHYPFEKVVFLSNAAEYQEKACKYIYLIRWGKLEAKMDQKELIFYEKVFKLLRKAYKEFLKELKQQNPFDFY